MGTIGSAIVSLFMFFVRIVVQTYTYVTLPLYYLVQNPSKVLKLSRKLRSKQLDPTDPYSPWVRTGATPYHVLATCRTLPECFEKMKQLYPADRPVIGYRTIIEEKQVLDLNGQPLKMDGKVVRKLRLTDYQWITYKQVMDKSQDTAKGLYLNGFQKYQKCVVLCETCPETLIFTIATQFIGITSVGLFTNLGDEGIVYAINETESQHIFTSYDLLPKVLGLLSRCPTLQTILFIESKLESRLDLINNNFNNNSTKTVQIIPLSKVERDGSKARKETILDPFDNDDVAVIGYTSGTSGQPKGVYFTLGQIRDAALALLPATEKFMANPERHIYVAYLPQAHVLEASIELIAFVGGARIGFASPFTLNESAPGLADGCACDLKLLKPTIMAGVPLVLDRMRKEMYLKLSKRTPFSTDIFNYLIDYKIHWTQKGYSTPIVNLLLCGRVREQFGGKIEQLILGGAPLCPQLQALIKASLNVKLIQGYGATELTGAVLAMDDNDLSYGRCGAPLSNIQIRLEDWPEGGYRATDEPYPRGELIVGGFGVSNGYYKNPELTGESFIFEDNGMRWFRTGDIAEIFSDGTFKIIDRKKDLIKLSNGEYFSLGKIEASLKNCKYVDNICVCGNDNHLVALVVPNRLALEQLAKQMHLNKGQTFSELCFDTEIIQIVFKDIIETGLKNKLNRRELPNKISICREVWTPDNGLLTAALKLKRPSIHMKYKLIIDRMFGRVSQLNTIF